MKCFVSQQQQKRWPFRAKGFAFMVVMALSVFLLPYHATAQTPQRVSGKITNEAGKPVPGATVVVKGGKNGVSSDENGNFSISALPTAVLVVSSIGYQPLEVNVNNTSVLSVQLKASNNDLDQIIVVGYGTQRKRDVTGSVASINEKALREVPVANLQQALQGRAAGLEVQRSSSKPGGGAVIRIRGERSINGSNDPLLVLDGIPFEGGNLNDINPDDVASVEVLKDASATAIYGSRGANGVILVSTKRGRIGETSVSYNGYYGINAIAKKYPVFNAQEYQAMRDISPWIEGYMATEKQSIALGRSTDWQDLMYESGLITDHNLSVSGGTENGQFSLGGGYFKETAVVPGQGFSRFSLRATIDAKVGKRIRIGLNTLNSLGITNGSQFVDGQYPTLSLSPLMPAYNADGSIFLRPFGNNTDSIGGYSPLLLKNNNGAWQDRIRRLRTFNSLFAEYQIITGLKYRINVGLDYRLQESAQFRAADVPTRPSYFRAGRGNTASVNNAEGWGYTIENVFTYDKTIANKHKIGVTALYSVQEDHTHNTSVGKDSITEDFIQYFDLGQASTNPPAVISGGETSWALLSYMARVFYSYNDKYMITLTGRRDGSSRLAAGNKWHQYPAVSVGWNVSNEDFMRRFTYVSNLKLRAGWGETSNQSINPYASLGDVSNVLYQGTNRVPIRYNYGPTQVTGYNVNTVPNSTLDWEYTRTTNIGIDFGFLANRITGSIDWYKAHTNKILYGINLPPTSGMSGQFITNIGEMENKGMEFSVSTRNIVAKTGFTWSTDLNLFYNRNKLLKLTDGFKQTPSSGLFIGEALTAIYDYKKLGIWQANEAAEAARYNSVPGQLKLEDRSGPNSDGKPDGKIDPNDDRYIIGKGEATLQGGMTNRFTYKGFDLSFVAYARFGGTLISNVYQPESNYLTTNNGQRNGLKVNYWTPTNPSNDFPSPAQAPSPISASGSTLGYYDATFVKIRSINLGYTFSGDALAKIKAKAIRIYVTVQNPFVLFSPYMQMGGLDPEATGIGYQGVANAPAGNISNRALTIGSSTPNTRAFLAGVNITL